MATMQLTPVNGETGSMLPELGPTGSKVVSGKLEIKSGVREVHWLPPGQPSREVPVYDDDGEVVDYAPVSDDEFARRTAAFERASARWNRTQGMAYVQEQPDQWTCEVTCEDGTTAEAAGDGKQWVWTRWDSPRPLTAKELDAILRR